MKTLLTLGVTTAVCLGGLNSLRASDPVAGDEVRRVNPAYLAAPPVPTGYRVAPASARIEIADMPPAIEAGRTVIGPTTVYATGGAYPPTRISAPAQSGLVVSPLVTPRQVYRPTPPAGPTAGSVYYGTGIIGQPKLYVSGQPLRNVLRYLTF